MVVAVLPLTRTAISCSFIFNADFSLLAGAFSYPILDVLGGDFKLHFSRVFISTTKAPACSVPHSRFGQKTEPPLSHRTPDRSHSHVLLITVAECLLGTGSAQGLMHRVSLGQLCRLGSLCDE